MSRTPKGKLFSIDGIRGREVSTAARRYSRSVQDDGGAFSIWDASGIFYELKGVKRNNPSAPTLILLYAADLHFRLRWQILPALEEGQTVVAAPYVETGIAAGLANGLSRKWLDDVFRFAPAADSAYWLNGIPVESGMRDTGFLEFARFASSPGFFANFASHFSRLERRRKIKTFEWDNA